MTLNKQFTSHTSALGVHLQQPWRSAAADRHRRGAHGAHPAQGPRSVRPARPIFSHNHNQIWVSSLIAAATTPCPPMKRRPIWQRKRAGSSCTPPPAPPNSCSIARLLTVLPFAYSSLVTLTCSVRRRRRAPTLCFTEQAPSSSSSFLSPSRLPPSAFCPHRIVRARL